MNEETCDCGHCREVQEAIDGECGVPWCKCKGYRMTDKPDFVAMLRGQEDESFIAAEAAQ